LLTAVVALQKEEEPRVVILLSLPPRNLLPQNSVRFYTLLC